jgi:hypothetical protein
MYARENEAMRRGVPQWTALLIACALISSCLLNSVSPITTAPRSRPDSGHAIVVIGMGLDVTWPYSEFQLTFPEYSVEKQSIAGNCFHYNRIEAESFGSRGHSSSAIANRTRLHSAIGSYGLFW